MGRMRRSGMRVTAMAAAVMMAATMTGCQSAGKVSASGYTEEQVKQRDIVNYHSFTGTIAPVDEKNVLPDLTGVKILEIYVDEGDEVKEGDVLFTLDRDTLEETIAELEATINATEQTNAASLNSAQSTYNNYKSDLDNGLNSSITSAKSQMDSAYASLVTAQENYNNEVELNNQQLSSSILQAQQNVDTAYNSLQSAELQLSQANDNLDDAKDALNKAKDQGIDTTQQESAVTSAEQAVDSAELGASSALNSYNNALTSYEQAKLNEENSLTQLYDTLIQAQTAYVNAVDAYNVAVRSSETTLEGYANQIQSAQASASSVESNRLKLQDYKDQLEDCEVKAPMDGVVTAVNIKEGDIAATTQAAMVITSFDTMKIDVKIDEYDILGVEEGSPVTVNIDALDKDYDGTIKTISRVATVSNGVSYFESEVDFDGDDDARSGMSAEVRLVTSEALGAVSVSSAAIQTADDGSAFVYVYEDENHKYLKEQPVTLGTSDGTYTEITEGLYLGDTILYMPTSAMEQMMETRSEMINEQQQ